VKLDAVGHLVRLLKCAGSAAVTASAACALGRAVVSVAAARKLLAAGGVEALAAALEDVAGRRAAGGGPPRAAVVQAAAEALSALCARPDSEGSAYFAELRARARGARCVQMLLTALEAPPSAAAARACVRALPSLVAFDAPPPDPMLERAPSDDILLLAPSGEPGAPSDDILLLAPSGEPAPVGDAAAAATLAAESAAPQTAEAGGDGRTPQVAAPAPEAAAEAEGGVVRTASEAAAAEAVAAAVHARAEAAGDPALLAAALDTLGQLHARAPAGLAPPLAEWLAARALPMLGGATVALRATACKTVARLAARGAPAAAALVARDAALPARLLALAGAGAPVVRGAAAAAMGALAADAATLAAWARPGSGAAEALYGTLMGGTDAAAAAEAVRCLAVFARASESGLAAVTAEVKALGKLEGVLPVAQAMARLGDAGAKVACAELLALLAPRAKWGASVCLQGAPELVRMLQNRELAVVVCAADTIAAMAAGAKDNCEVLREAGALIVLSGLLDDTNARVRARAARAVGALAAERRCIALMLRIGVVRALLALLRSGPPAVTRHAAAAMEALLGAPDVQASAPRPASV
jgi:hypothetical protein